MLIFNRFVRNMMKRVGFLLIITSIILILLADLSMTPPFLLAQEGQTRTAQQQGYDYRVQRGDNWDMVAEHTGIPRVVLQETNPQAIRENLWLRVGDVLFIPTDSVAGSTTREHTVEFGQSWSTIANQYNIEVRLLRAVNPELVRQDFILYQEEVLLIPPAIELPDQSAIDATATAVASMAEVYQTATAVAYQASVGTGNSGDATGQTTGDITVSQSSSKEPSVAILDSAAAQSNAAANINAAQAEEAANTASPLDSCPTLFTDYSIPIEFAMTGPNGDPQVLRDYLLKCDAEILFQVDDWTGDALDDLLIIYKNPDTRSAYAENDLVIFNGVDDKDAGGSGYQLVYRARSASTVNLLATEDVNNDGRFDIVWLETTCGASTCFSTVNIRSWDGNKWADWASEKITMAYGDVTLQAEESGSGQVEFVLRGGIHGSSKAGPQRSRMEVWRSINGAPYAMVSREYDESPCLYFSVIDANAALESGTPEGLSEATALYKRVAVDQSLISCDWRAEEEQELRSFGRFRVAAMAAYQGDSSTAEEQIQALESNYANSPYARLGRLWLDAYLRDGDPEAACMTTDTFVQETPETWQILDNYGFSNPSFSPEEVCPKIGLIAAMLQIVESETDDTTSAQPENLDQEIPVEAILPETTAPETTAPEIATPEIALPEATPTAVQEIATSEITFPEATPTAIQEIATPEIALPEATPTAIQEIATPEITFPEATPTAIQEIIATLEVILPEATPQPIAEATVPAPTPEPVLTIIESAPPSEPIVETETNVEESPTSVPETSDAIMALAVAPTLTTDQNDAGSDDAESGDAESDDEESSIEDILSVVEDEPSANTEESTIGGLIAGGTTANRAPACPQSLQEYGMAGQQALNFAKGDVNITREWMLSCGVMTTEQGSIMVQDITADGLDDVVLYPITNSTVGYGPEGTQGSVLIYHQQPASSDPDDLQFLLTANPDVFGEPQPLGIADYNQDGLTDIAWTVEGCYTFCVTEVQLLSWTGEYYIVNIASGATIAEGKAIFRPANQVDSLAQGQELVLTGGVSGTPEGGLSIPHEEIWQSIDGSAYQRVRWTYSRDNENNNCMGLRLVEANVAIQAAPLIGYQQAIELYSNSISPTLRACSIYGMPQENEIVILQGLATFRLIQAQTLSGDFDAAALTLDALSRGQPDGIFASMSKQWLNEYRISQNPASACVAVQPIIEDNNMVWQVTDHYGYNHPALAPEQICYQPSL